MATADWVQCVLRITEVLSTEDTSGGYMTPDRQVGDLIIDHVCLDLYPVPKVGEVVDFTYWQESEGIFGHLILKGQGEVVYVSHYDEPVFEDWCSHCGANHVVGTCDYYLDEA